MERHDSRFTIKRVALYGLAAGCAFGVPILAYKVANIVHELCWLGHEALEHKYGITFDKRFGFDIGPRT